MGLKISFCCVFVCVCEYSPVGEYVYLYLVWFELEKWIGLEKAITHYISIYLSIYSVKDIIWWEAIGVMGVWFMNSNCLYIYTQILERGSFSFFPFLVLNIEQNVLFCYNLKYIYAVLIYFSMGPMNYIYIHTHTA